MNAQLHLSTSNFEPALDFYQTLLGRKPVMALEDYARFSFEGFRLELQRRADPISVNPMDAQYGIALSSSEAVLKVAQRLESAGLVSELRTAEDCCHSVQTKVWTRDPDGRRWKAFTILDPGTDSDQRPRLGSRVRDWFEALAQGASSANSSSDVVTDSLEREWLKREQARYPRGFS
ncbi:MAG: VOC family protein [Vulcanimicrobiaceae bacterium]